MADKGVGGTGRPVPQRYLDGLPADDQRALLERVNGDGLRALRGHLASGQISPVVV